VAHNNIQKILRILHREPCSQAELCEKLKLSKSHIHKLISNLIEPGLIEKTEDFQTENTLGRPRQTLKISQNLQYCTVLVVHTDIEFKASIFVYGHEKALGSVDLPFVDYALDFANTLDAAIDTLTQNYFLNRSLILSIVIATHATVEQGEHGIMYRNNMLRDKNIGFADLVAEVTKIRTFVYNYAYGNLLSLKHNPHVDTSYALVIHNGHGSVALGLFLNNEITLGKNNSFPECSHLPFPYGFEQSLGEYTPHTEEALYFAISVLAPIYNMNEVIISGDCLLQHQDVIDNVGSMLKHCEDPRLHNIHIRYCGSEARHNFEELVYLSFDSLVEVLDPQIASKDLESLVSKISYSNF